MASFIVNLSSPQFTRCIKGVETFLDEDFIAEMPEVVWGWGAGGHMPLPQGLGYHLTLFEPRGAD